MSKKVRNFIDGLSRAFSMDKGSKDLDEQDLALVEKLADFVIKRGMAEPALMFLETIRPLNFIGSQAMVFFRPIITVFFSPKDYERLSQILEKRESIDILIEKIKTKELENEKCKFKI